MNESPSTPSQPPQPAPNDAHSPHAARHYAHLAQHGGQPNQRPPQSQPTAPNHAPGSLPKIAPPSVRPIGDIDPHRDSIALDDEEELQAAPAATSKIKAFGTNIGSGMHSAQYKRQTSVSGQGACRVRSFHGRLSDEGMAYMDDKINEWLDGHPDIEVKFVTTSVGMYDGKIKEEALVVNIWY